MSIALQFGAVSDAFQAKHGKLYCAYCRRTGLKVPAVLMPVGWPKSAAFRKDFACCAEHQAVALAGATQRVQADSSDHESEGEYQARRQFGF